MNNMNNEVKTSVAGIRKAIGTQLRKANINYNYSLILSKTYCGEGFYVNHKDRSNEIVPIYGNDKHAAYMGSLLKYEFPLSSELSYKEDSPLSILHIEFTDFKPRYPEFYYTLYQHNIEGEKINGKTIKHLLLTHLDYEIFMDLYESDAVIKSQRWFKSVGKLPLQDVVNKYYDFKKMDTGANKYKYEAGFYGMFAKTLCKDPINAHKILSVKEYANFYNAVIDTGLSLEIDEDIKNKKALRNAQVPIAIWQTAYLRYEEWKLFKSHIDTVVYMNTDSIYCQQPTGIIPSDKIGQFKQEYNGELIFWIRRNAYCVVDKDLNIKKAILGGIIENHGLTTEKVNQLRMGETVKANTFNRDKEQVEVDLTPRFLLYDYDPLKV